MGTDADQGGSADAIEEDKNNFQNVSDERNESDTSDEVGSCRDDRHLSNKQNEYETSEYGANRNQRVFDENSSFLSYSSISSQSGWIQHQKPIDGKDEDDDSQDE